MYRGQLAMIQPNSTKNSKHIRKMAWKQAWPGHAPQSKHCIQMLIMATQYANWQSLQYADCAVELLAVQVCLKLSQKHCNT
jgi:hypothetical protein